MRTPVAMFTDTTSRDLTPLKEALTRFLAAHAWDSPHLLARAARQWYGSSSERAELVEATMRDRALLEAWEIADLAGPLAAKALPILVQRYLGSGSNEDNLHAR